jgi:hypothetical protein
MENIAEIRLKFEVTSSQVFVCVKFQEFDEWKFAVAKAHSEILQPIRK